MSTFERSSRRRKALCRAIAFSAAMAISGLSLTTAARAAQSAPSPAAPTPAAPKPATPATVSAPQTGALETVAVLVDHAKVVRLPEKAQTVIVGNPSIADVSVQRNGVMVVTGKSFGITNLIALDASGALLAESLVRVGAASDSVLTVQRGLERETYSCSPVCQPATRLGDAQRYFVETTGQVGARNTQATGGLTR